MDTRNRLSVYFLSGCKACTTFEYRVLQKLEQLSLYGMQGVAQQDLAYSKATIAEALSHDLIFLYRVAHSPLVEELIEQARGCHIPVIFGVDDLVFDPQVVNEPVKRMPHEHAAHYYEGSWRFRRTLLASDVVITATEDLAERARALGKSAFVHRNGLSQSMIEVAETLRQQRKEHDTLIIGYSSGTATHNRDFMEVSTALARVMARHRDVELHVRGPLRLPTELMAFGSRVRSLPLVPWDRFLGVLNSFDVNLAPLEHGNPFCHAKSEVKYVEAALLGIPTIASRIGAFEYAIRDGENGFLAGNLDEWEEKLGQLIADPALRERMGQAAHADVMARYTPAALGKRLARTLSTIRKQHAEERTPVLRAAPDPRHTPLILNWLITEPTPGSGGHTDILRMINLLADFGHHSNVYVIPRHRFLDMSDLEIRQFLQQHFANLNGSVFKWTGDRITKSDALILTHWTTAYEIDDVRNTSKVFYFVQDWEPFFCPMGSSYLRAEQTYKMGFSCITLGRWLTEHLDRQYNADADYFDLAVDHAIYRPRSIERPPRQRVCFYARPSTPRRLFPIGIEALALIHRRCPDVELVFYGVKDDDLYPHTISFPFTNLGILSEHELAKVFSSSDVGIVLSSTNCSLIPPEMMACKCAVVDLDRETVRGVLEHKVNALLAEPTPRAIADAVIRLLEDEPLRQRLVETAYQQVRELSWTKSAQRVEEILYEKLPAARRLLSLRRSEVQPGLPDLDALPEGQREHLNAIHHQRRGPVGRCKAIARRWINHLLRTDRGLRLAGSPVRTARELVGRRSIGQSFVARHDSLYRIDLLVATYRRRNTRDVIFHLKESPSAETDLATVRLNASLLSDNGYASFIFQPQAESCNKSYYFYVESPESITGDAITLWAYTGVTLEENWLYQNGRMRKGQLVFGTFYMDDQFGKVGERPFPHAFEHVHTSRERATKLFRLITSRNLTGLRWEVVRYLEWKISTM